MIGEDLVRAICYIHHEKYGGGSVAFYKAGEPLQPFVSLYLEHVCNKVHDIDYIDYIDERYSFESLELERFCTYFDTIKGNKVVDPLVAILMFHNDLAKGMRKADMCGYIGKGGCVLKGTIERDDCLDEFELDQVCAILEYGIIDEIEGFMLSFDAWWTATGKDINFATVDRKCGS